MPKPEIHLSHAFGMGFWIAEDGTLMSCPAFENGSFDVDNAIFDIDIRFDPLWITATNTNQVY